MGWNMKVLDLFCGAGGAAMGLHRAWPDAEITGVDNRPQPRYPFKFVLGDAMTFPLEGYDFIWASPVCKRYSKTAAMWRSRNHPDQVGALRDKLYSQDAPWVIENVVGAPLRHPTMLCGLMFGLKVLRHRLFESSFAWLAPSHPYHNGTTNAHRGLSTGGEYICVAGHNFLVAEAARAMEIDWMSQIGLSQAIPPAYSEFIARQFRL